MLNIRVPLNLASNLIRGRMPVSKRSIDYHDLQNILHILHLNGINPAGDMSYRGSTYLIGEQNAIQTAEDLSKLFQPAPNQFFDARNLVYRPFLGISPVEVHQILFEAYNIYRAEGRAYKSGIPHSFGRLSFAIRKGEVKKDLLALLNFKAQ